ncbi:MAG: glycosyltransferase family 4 protein [Eubacteriales bacterium]
MKKICFITQCSLPIPTVKGGAVETLVEYILDENEKKPAYEFTVIGIEDVEAQKSIGGYKHTKFLYVPMGNKKGNKLLSEASRIFKHININLPASIEFYRALQLIKKIEEQDLFIYEAGPTTHLALLKKLIPKEKLVVHLHWDGMGTKWKDDCLSYLIPVSHYIGTQWIKASGCRPEKVKPLYNCTKIERFIRKPDQKENAELRRSLKIKEENKVIIFTGRIVEDKGVKQLLEAYSGIKRDDVTLIIIGSANFGEKTRTKYEAEVERLISECKKQIVFTGFVHQTQLYRYYAIADIAVMPSLFQDPAPLVCIETQATGTPLIATRVGGIPEYAAENGVVWVEKDDELVESLKSAMESLLNDEKRREDMSRYEVDHALKYSTEKYFQNFCSLMSEMIP